jgi:hypothetical protein
MALSFNDAHGSARKNKLPYMQLAFGETTFRLVGDILPRYVYWKNLNGKNVPVECLAFNRETEKFDNAEMDHFHANFSDEKCVWSYVMQCIDTKTGELKLMGLKKKLFEQIQALGQEIGDPTNVVTGWDVIVDKKKTGPHDYNVEYRLKERAIAVRELTDAEKELVDNMKPIEELITRQTPDSQRDFIEKNWLNMVEETNADEDAISDLDNGSDPF